MDSIRSDRLKMYVKRQSIVERYVLRRNQNRVARRDRGDGLREAEGWDVELETSESGVSGRGIE